MDKPSFYESVSVSQITEEETVWCSLVFDTYITACHISLLPSSDLVIAGSTVILNDPFHDLMSA